MRRVCIYHAGCPDGFGAAWAARRAWGDSARYIPRGHGDGLRPGEYRGAQVLFADIAPPPGAWRALADCAERLVVLDHHVTERDRFFADAELGRYLAEQGHEVLFDLEHSGAVLAWQWLHPGEAVPELLAYIEDRDLWRFALPESHAVNAAIDAAPRSFASWDALAQRPAAELAREGAPILRAFRQQVERALESAHPVRVGEVRMEAVNARNQRAEIGHELATRARFGAPCGAVYRIYGGRAGVSLYSLGDFDVAAICAGFGGGGHRNAAGFSLPLSEWFACFG